VAGPDNAPTWIPIEDASGFQGRAEKVFAPSTAAEVSALLHEANAARTPVTFLGAGSGVTGGGVPQGGWAISLEKFRRLDLAPGQARTGAGVLLKELHAAARANGQFFAPDPTHDAAALGGAIANNASGSRSFRYGSIRRHVLSLQVALPTGEIREFSRGEPIDFDVPAISRPRTTKHQCGYPLAPGMDWVDLFIGSEGTLGAVLEATVQLLPARGPLLTGVVFFPTEAATLDALFAWRSIDRLCMLESMDAASISLIPNAPRAGGALLIEQEDPDEDAWIERLQQAGALLDESWFGTTEADRERFRRIRHSLPEQVNDTVRRNGYLKMGTDYAVPIDRLREMFASYREGLDTFPGKAVIYGHAGDGHVHVNLMPASDAEARLAWDLVKGWAKKAVQLEGTPGAEHGLGKRKAHLLELLYSPGEIEAMKDVKRRLDPHWILGRGTLFPLD
jgi:FAD/FMN-containing dehydrogenase